MIFFLNLVCIALLFSSLTNKEIPKFPHYLHHGRPKKCWKISCLAGSVRNVLIAKNFFYKHFKAKSLTIGLKDDDDKGDDRLDDTELQGPLLAEPAAIMWGIVKAVLFDAETKGKSYIKDPFK